MTTVLLALGGAYILRDRLNLQGWLSQPEPAPGQTLGLKIQRQGADLILSWNRNAPDMLGATAGLLSVKDGQAQREIGLTAEQLRLASILISPQSDHVEVQLTVLLPNQRTSSESGIVILPAPGQSDPVEIQATVPPKNYTPAEIVSQAPRPKATKAFVPPGRSQSPSAQPMEQPPALDTTDPLRRIHPAEFAASRQGLAPRAITEAPASTSPAGSSLPARAGGNVQPAEIISRSEPVYPYAARVAGIRGTVVLEGVVGLNGRVKDLKVVSGAPTLRQAAVTAVNQWIYRPALLNGKPIESRIRAEIRFQ
jgi:protein TonB